MGPCSHTFLRALAVLLLLPAAAVTSAEEAAQTRIDALIEHLGHVDPAQRNAAEQALRRLGASALPRLKHAAGHEDVEVRRRVRRLAAAAEPNLLLADAEAATEPPERYRHMDPRQQFRMLHRAEHNRYRRAQAERRDRTHWSIEGLGVVVLEASPVLIEQLRLAQTALLVTELDAGTTLARRIGLEPGDLLLQPAGPLSKTIDKLDGLADELRDNDVVLRVIRRGRPVHIDVAAVLRERNRVARGPRRTDETITVSATADEERDPFSDALDGDDLPVVRIAGLGIRVREPDAMERRHLRLEPGAAFVVTWVELGSIASRLGVEPTDIVLAVDGKPCGSAEELLEASWNIEEGTNVELTVLRGGRTARVDTRPALYDPRTLYKDLWIVHDVMQNRRRRPGRRVRAAAQKLEGIVTAVNRETVLISIGARDGVRVGHTFAISRRGNHIGELRVTKTLGKTSHAELIRVRERGVTPRKRDYVYGRQVKGDRGVRVRRRSDGRVLTVKGTLVMISIGANDGVRVGDEYRLSRNQTYIGKLRITKVEKRRSRGRLADVKGALPRKSDRVYYR